MPGRGPSPDFDQVTLKWYGVNLDGSPVTGRLELVYNGVTPMLDEDPVYPVSIYPTILSSQIQTAVIPMQNAAGQLTDRTVGYVSWSVPASDDPDIAGSGGTYTLTERLDNGRGQVRTFVASKDAPGGVIWLSRIVSVTPVPGEPISAVSVAEVELLKTQVQQILDDGVPGGGGGPVNSDAITDAGAVGKAVLVSTTQAQARNAIGAGTGNSNLAIGTTFTTAKAGDYKPTAAEISDATTLGRAVLKAADAAAARTALGVRTTIWATFTAAQGVPTPAQCAAMGMPDGALFTVDPA